MGRGIEMSDREIIDWVFEGDPSIRWQAKRDLADAEEEEVRSERMRVGTEGWGVEILSRQDPDGKWAGQLYIRKWISTTYTMLLLKEFGLLPNEKTEAGCRVLFENGIFEDREIRFSLGQRLRDVGVTGMVLGILCYFGFHDPRLKNIAEFLAYRQRPDGAWVYDDRPGAEDYLFENTLLIVKALREYREATGDDSAEILEAWMRANEFLLDRRLINPNDPKCLLFSFPNYWHYDVLAALDYFREADIADPRLADAIRTVRAKRNDDGTWNLQNRHPGRTFIDMETVGKPSRWNTLRAMRVLKWWKKANGKTFAEEIYRDIR
ncbi:MAG: hypothetical protein JW817_03930 [Clostridiales bacterium]|nr:hypothetical protein [Clostridiales bacterium]